MVSVKVDSYTITPEYNGEAIILGEIYNETDLLFGYDPADDSYKISNEDEKDQVLKLFKKKFGKFEREEKQGV